MTGLALSIATYPNLLRLLLWIPLAGLLAAGVVISASASEDPGLAAIGGEGAGAISGFVVSEIHYSLADDNPGRLAAVELTVLAADGSTTPSRVSVSLQAGAPATTCLPTEGPSWTCPLDAPLREAESLRVSASR